MIGKCVQSKEVTLKESYELDEIKICIPMLSGFGNVIGVVAMKSHISIYKDERVLIKDI